MARASCWASSCLPCTLFLLSLCCGKATYNTSGPETVCDNFAHEDANSCEFGEEMSLLASPKAALQVAKKKSISSSAGSDRSSESADFKSLSVQLHGKPVEKQVEAVAASELTSGMEHRFRWEQQLAGDSLLSLISKGAAAYEQATRELPHWVRRNTAMARASILAHAEIITAVRIATFMIWATLLMLFAVYYSGNKEYLTAEYLISDEKAVSNRPPGDWQFKLFECLEQPGLSLLSCFCGPVRWADTVSMAGLMPFLTAAGLLTFCVLFELVCLVIGLSISQGILSIAILIFLIHYRQRLRSKLNYEHGTCTTVAADCLTYAFCGPCAIVQEARELEHRSSQDDI
eukprot:gnl/TRDRNA2_/TRDRNA2_184821_c0_seq1.p1 gnl/TRDRNA2_/TRDRNA2_184821_c0~~gnl/TRDRNA2_/TRDRNA2_184821_c0_seq1.p1  ORF type:complete len:346 (+),score=46.46 gnl/TRDRNA2_/TRDRNA2_184821_c0_seq1:113-1150(+)